MSNICIKSFVPFISLQQRRRKKVLILWTPFRGQFIYTMCFVNPATTTKNPINIFFSLYLYA